MDDLDLTEVCRICLTKHEDMQLAVEVDAIDKLSDCASVELPPESLICEFCTNEVNKWYSFKQQVLKSVEVAKYIEGRKNQKEQPIINNSYAVIEEYFVKSESDHQLEQVEIKREIIDVEGTDNEEETSTHDKAKEEMNSSCKRTYKCDICGKILSSLSGLLFHKFTHSKPSSIESSKDNLVVTLTTETEEKKYQCDLCHKSFISKNGIMWHKQIHSALKLDLSKDSERFPCPYCPMIYEKKSSLIDHMRWKHNRLIKRTRQSAVCDVCGKQCKSKADFKAHMRIHNGEKPHICLICNKGFITSSKLKTHRRIHTGETPFVCGDCGRGFKRQRGLVAHQLTHQKNGLVNAPSATRHSDKNSH